MKLRFCNLFLFFLPLALLSCTSPKKMARGTEIISKNQDSVQNLLIFPTCSYIEVIEKRDTRVNSYRFSSEAENEIYNRLVEFLPASLDKQFMQNDSLLRESIASSGIRLIKSLKKSFNAQKARVPDYLLQVLNAQGQDYGLLILQVGFTRTPDNYKKEYIRRQDLGWTTLGIYTTEPNSSYSTMFGLLIDKKRKRVVKYKELSWRNKDPNDKYIIRTQVRDIILTSFQLGN
jgi:hypothetical protein